MREIMELMGRLNQSMNSLCQLRVCGRSWGIYCNDKVVIGDGGKRCGDPTADIIAALKAKLPPTKAEALESMRIIETNIPSGLHCVDTVRRYLEAQKE
jgi:hypothetical protein